MTRTDENRQLIEGFWADLYRQDFAALGDRFAPDGEYTDIVTPEDDVARGAAEITAGCASRSTSCRSCTTSRATSSRGSTSS